MLKELALLGAMASLYITQPNRANETTTKTFLNSTDYSIMLNDEVILQPHQEYDLPAQPGYFSDLYIEIQADEEPAGIYYWTNQVDNENEVLITWTQEPLPGTPIWTADLPDMSNDSITGIQFFKRRALAGEVFYIMQPNLSNQGLGIGNILPDGSSALLEIQGGGSVSITKLTYQKTHMETGILGYAYFRINDLTIIANNSTTGTTPNSQNELTQIMLYQSNYTNKITFTGGYYTRMWNAKGYNDNIPMLSNQYQPYATFTTAGNTEISLVPLTTGVKLVGISFEALNSLFGYVVFPGLTLGMLILVPIFLGIMFTIIKLVKKG